MRLRSIEYSESLNTPTEWILRQANFNQANLVVGRNASGKTRLLNVINSLASLMTGTRQIFSSGTYDVIFFDSDDCELHLNIVMDHKTVIYEMLTRADEVLLKRNADGTGKILTRDFKGMLDFKVPSDQLAIQVKRDSIQHAFLEPLYDWAKYTLHHLFADDKDKHTLISFTNNERKKNTGALHPVILLKKAEEKFNDKLKAAIIEDLEKLEYFVSDVGIAVPDDIETNGPLVFGIYVQEKDLKCTTSQIQMSHGMYRALSLVIRLNYSLLNDDGALFLIDDIGEGLDYKRAQSIVDLTMNKTMNSSIQVITSTNDQFIMNGIPLEYWSIVDRQSSVVSLINIENKPEVFKRYKSVGLNNFEFFSSQFFLE